MRSKKPIAVIGAGSWGTALAILLASNNQTVNLWGRNPEYIQRLQADRCNDRYLPDIPFPSSLNPCSDIQTTLENVEDILLVIPAKAVRETLQLIKPYITANSGIALATKGLDPVNLCLLHEVVQKELTENTDICIISGPTFAVEVAKGLPTAVTVASDKETYANKFGAFLQNEFFRVYTSTDIIGVELGGTVKNAMAIAAGISDGMGFGANARAALITRGLHEISQLGIKLGGKAETFMGLAGLGDLVLTCTENKSRNRRVGLGLAKNKSIEEILEELGQVAEGVATAKSILLLANKLEVEMPIVEQVYEVIYKHKSPKQAVHDLLKRDPRPEN